jgi:hypothetical protein
LAEFCLKVQEAAMNQKPAGKLLLLLATFTTLTLAACQAPAVKTTHYSGQIDNSKAFIGLATNGNDILAYACDGTETDVTIAEWFKGTLSAKSFRLTSKSNAQLNGQIGEAATGTLTLADGSTFAFSAPLATGDAGLYRREVTENGTNAVTGWIVLKDGEIHGATFYGGAGGPPLPGSGIGGGGFFVATIRTFYYRFP